MRYFLLHITRMPLLTAFLLLVAASGMWAVDYIRVPELWLSVLISQCLAVVNGVMLCVTLYRAKATNRFSLLPAVLFVSAVAVFPYLRMHWQPQLLVCVLLFFLYSTRGISDTHEPNGLVFFVTLLLCLTALLVKDALWCIVFLWAVVLLQGVFSFRTIIASLLAVLLVGVYYTVALYFGWAEVWDVSVLYERHWFGNDQPVSLTTAVCVILFAFLLVTAGAFRRSSYDLVSARMLLYHVVVCGLLSLPLILFMPAVPDSLVLLPFSLSAVTAVFLSQKESETRGVTLLLYLTGAVVLFLWLVLSL